MPQKSGDAVGGRVQTHRVLTVYLDQMKWIGLAQAAHGNPLGRPHQPALEALRAAAAEGRAQFPLSAAHYYETGKQHRRRSRMELATTMVELSGGLRIAPPQTIVPWEIRRAMIEVLGLEGSVPDIELFGYGVAHAMGHPSLRYTAPAEFMGVELTEQMRAEFERRGGPAFEAMALAQVMPVSAEEKFRLNLNEHETLTDQKFVGGQHDVAGTLVDLGRHRLDDLMYATAYTDIREPVAHAAVELDVGPEQVADHWRDLVQAMPSRWVEMMLRRLRQANPQKAWEGNDLNDVIALSVAVPYCDVVVTEKSWSSMLNDAKVPQRFNTLVTRRLDDVVTLLGKRKPDHPD